MSKKNNSTRSNHHRRPRSRGGNGTKENLIEVSKKQHKAWHLLFANNTPYQIADHINNVWLDPDYKFICVRR